MTMSSSEVVCLHKATSVCKSLKSVTLTVSETFYLVHILKIGHVIITMPSRGIACHIEANTSQHGLPVHQI